MIAVIITGMVCITLVIVTFTDKITEVADKKNFYEAVAKDPEAMLTILKEVKNNGN